MRADWKKIGKHEHRWKHYQLVRRTVFGGNTWQVFCMGPHEGHEEWCSPYALVSQFSIQAAKIRFEEYLQNLEALKRGTDVPSDT